MQSTGVAAYTLPSPLLKHFSLSKCIAFYTHDPCHTHTHSLVLASKAFGIRLNSNLKFYMLSKLVVEKLNNYCVVLLSCYKCDTVILILELIVLLIIM